jgi:hypothetical protein
MPGDLFSITGPISTSPWKANYVSSHPSRHRTQYEPAVRLTDHPIRNNAASTRLAFAEPQEVTAVSPC